MTLTWTASEPAITGYGVQLVDSASGAPVGALRETTATTTLTVYNLPAGSYAFTVRARNANGYGRPSQLSAPIAVSAADRISVDDARWRPDELRVRGTGSVPGARVTVHRAGPDGAIGAPASNLASTLVGADGDFEIRLRRADTPSDPVPIYVVSDRGGVAGPLAVTN